MAGISKVAVIDIGKTNAKVALVDLSALQEIAVRKTPNTVLADGLYPHHDVERLWAFILDALRDLNVAYGVDAISITTHGATAVLLDADGELALPVLDYEFAGPDEIRGDYSSMRPDFANTGSPALPLGLNIGAQLFWQNKRYHEAFDRTATILMYPQYWAWRLTGIMANEVTSLGCHTDLWDPQAANFSSLVDAMKWRNLFAPVRPASESLGPILADIAARTGLDPGTPVACGIHDSNASLVPHLINQTAPFSVVSTGTWVISMAIGAAKVRLDPARDTLINVNAFGDAVPSSRVMGGREYELLGGATMTPPTEADIDAVLAGGKFLLPSVQEGCGPFPTQTQEWIGGELSPGERTVAVSFYLALMTATCLELIGADGPTIVEGPFAANALFVRMLSAATGRSVHVQPGQVTGTSIGAAMLMAPSKAEGAAPIEHLMTAPAWTQYSADWRVLVERALI